MIRLTHFILALALSLCQIHAAIVHTGSLGMQGESFNHNYNTLPHTTNNAQRRSVDLASAPRMVIKNRTWWYHLDRCDGTVPGMCGTWNSEFGIQIGDEVEIDGIMWHEMNVVKRGDGNYYHGMIVEDEYPICISYIREEGDNVYALLDKTRLSAYPQLMQIMQHSRWAPYISDSPEEVTLYHFGNENDIYEMGAAAETAVCAIRSVTTEEFECFDFDNVTHTVERVRVDKPGFMDGYTEFTVVEGVGAFSADKEHISLFFAPFTDNTYESEYEIPVLSYVTDGDYRHTSPTVVFEGAGGWAQWEYLVSSPDIEVSDRQPSARWYSIDGVEVTEPLTPGVYVKIAGNSASKVVVR